MRGDGALPSIALTPTTLQESCAMNLPLPAAVTASLRAPKSAPATLSVPPLLARVQALFDTAAQAIDQGQVLAAFRGLVAPFSALWTEAKAQGAQDEVRALALAHRLHAMTQHDPFTWRAAHKPRGYAGDAVMMDFIYSGVAPQGTSELGRSIFAVTTRDPMGLSVMFRRSYLQSLIDGTVAPLHGARILSVAAGHCRELQGSLVQTPWFDGEFVALDQDPLSCAEVARSMAGHRVRVIEQGVRELASRAGTPEGAAAYGQFDLIYSAGLYDYLPDALARRLTQRLAGLLRPGGRLVLGNFVPTGHGRGYMEAFMDWTLIVRSEAELRALNEGALPGGQAGDISSFMDPQGNVAYTVLRRPD
jgi:extracellular factor (EF) 3-hydroxypalmitic acid methyl ester biosynthesis protein